jgi:CYTH domain-containing protein
MNKTATTEFHRLFLIEDLPEPLTRASSHIQIFDNYVEGTRLRIRNIRDPETKVWTHVLQQKFPASDDDASVTKLAEIYLNESEYALFERFEGREIRKNRYFHEIDHAMFAFDVYLGDLWGLNTARVDFDSLASAQNFEPPPFAVFEVTSDPFFAGENLVGKRFDAIQAEVARIAPLATLLPQMPDA